MKNRNNNFIMSPTVDFCFKELMCHPNVRKSFLGALLRLDPKEIEETQLLPVSLRRASPDEKLGILDVRVHLKGGLQMNLEMQIKYFEYWDERVLFYLSKMFSEQLEKGGSYESLKKCIHVSILDFIHFPGDRECYRTIHLRDDKTGKLYTDKMELQILELKKLPKVSKTKDAVISWMRFFSGKTREEFEAMAKTSEYLDEAYQALLHLSEDDKKRLEYEAREKALKDYNTQMRSAEKRGLKKGAEYGADRVNRLIQALLSQSRTEDISRAVSDKGYQEELFKEFHL